MKNVYLTSTFTNPWNVEFNPKIGEALEKKGITCFLAHRDTDQKGANELKFSSDMAGINDSSLILAIALNESPNWGAEVGYAYGVKKPVIGLTDKNHAIPLICEGMVSDVIRVDNLDSIEEYIDLVVEKIKQYI